MFSPDYGATWLDREIAFDTPSSGNLPHNILADENWVHILAEPGAGTYVRRRVILPGDFSLDGAVDAADYIVWRKTDDTQSKYNSWSTHFGEPSGSGSGTSANTNVPEPVTWAMLIVAAVGIRLRRRHSA